MASLIGKIRGMLRRKPAGDAFGGEDEDFDETFEEPLDEDEDAVFEEDEEPAPVGRRVPLIVSGLLCAVLVGLGITIYVIGKDAPPSRHVIASLDELEVEEVEDVPATATPVHDSTATTDHSAERRPWLANSPEQKGTATAKPGKPTHQADTGKHVTPDKGAAHQAVMTPPAPAKPVPKGAKTEAHTPEPADTHSLAGLKTEEAAERPSTAETPKIAATTAAEAAPGAPQRCVGDDTEPTTGRPRLVEPDLPPVERANLTAPPPRYGNLAPIKHGEPSASGGKRGRIAIMVQGLGMNQAATGAAVSKLPSQITLSLSPYARNIRKWLGRLKQTGHEVLVEVPMESKRFPAEDPGPLGLMTALEAKENIERLATILRTFPNAIGIDDVSGSKFREAETAMRPVFNVLKEKSLFYIQGQPGVQIGDPGVPSAVADIVIDERPFRAAIDARLDYAERLAKFQGAAVVVMSAKPVSFERLALWLTEVNRRGIEIAPISEVLVR